jgi:predicted enzyme related to lactoylglutathione lyase
MSGVIVHTIVIETGNLHSLADFYRQGLELGEPQATGSDHVGFPLPNTYLGFDQVDKQRSEYPGAVSLWFEVENLEITFERFKTLGAQVKYPPTRKPWGAVLAAVHDPDGNIIGLAQKGTSPQYEFSQ